MSQYNISGGKFNGRRTIAVLIVEAFETDPNISNEELTEKVLLEFPNSTYEPARAVTDRRKFNKALFTCQEKREPETEATDPQPKKEKGNPNKKAIMKAGLETNWDLDQMKAKLFE